MHSSAPLGTSLSGKGADRERASARLPTAHHLHTAITMIMTHIDGKPRRMRAQDRKRARAGARETQAQRALQQASDR